MMNDLVAHYSSFSIYHSSFIMRPSVPDVHITDSQDAEFAAYRPLAVQAVVGLIFGLLAPLALLNSVFWAVPAIGIFFSGWAIRRIERDPAALTGRKLAWVGLSLSLLLIVAAPTDLLVYRRIVRGEARRFSDLWFRYLTHGEPQKAHQLTVAPQTRQPLDEHLWGFYRNTPPSRKALEGYVKSPLVRTLLALGPRASVRFYETAGQAHDDNNDVVELLYAVTYEGEEGERKSFFVDVSALRTKLADGSAGWRILQAGGGAKPDGWQEAVATPD
jgi:hypothetical protein